MGAAEGTPATPAAVMLAWTKAVHTRTSATLHQRSPRRGGAGAASARRGHLLIEEALCGGDALRLGHRRRRLLRAQPLRLRLARGGRLRQPRALGSRPGCSLHPRMRACATPDMEPLLTTAACPAIR